MSKITFIIGGARSGKSTYAHVLAKQYKRKVAFIATAEAKDHEMGLRIKLHRQSRPKHWQTFEEDADLVFAIKKIGKGFQCIILDCLTLWVSNLLLAGKSPKNIEDSAYRTLKELRKKNGRIIIVSNEVGMGIVPVNKLAREFRDIAGKINQVFASQAEEVIFMVAGIPAKIK